MRRSFVLAALLCGALHAETVLVLPFFNQSSTQSLDWIGESIAESLNDTLAYQGLLVLNRDDRLEAYRRLSLRPGAELTHASVLKIGQALDASSVIYGYYEKTPASATTAANSSLRVKVRIVDLKRLRPVAEFTEIRSLEDLAALEAHLGWQTLKRLTPKDTPDEQTFMRARPPVRLDAVESYVRGLLAQTPEQRQRFFMQSARLDEHYSPPRYQLGMAFWTSKDYPNAGTWLTKVDSANPHYLEAQFFLGLCLYYGGDFAGAEHAFQLVAASVPLNEVFNNLGAAQGRRNNTEGATASFQKALDGDSADPDYHFNLGYTLWKAGKFPEAVTSFRAVLERNPGDTEATSLLGRALKRDGPRPGDPKSEARERLKTNYEEDAYRQLQAELKPKQ
jgi:tetratricopeptide (TPR) repeat protein